MSSHSNPFEELERLFERLSEGFEQAASGWDRGEFIEQFPPRPSVAIDVVERDEAFVLTADLPGYEKDDITVSAGDTTLQIRAERESATEERDVEYIRKERHHETRERSIPLPGAVDTDGITAKMRHGILTVTLPKAESERGHTIDIE